MNPQPSAGRRRLTLFDLNLMVVAAALALAGYQYAVTYVFPGRLSYSRWPGWIANPSLHTTLYMFSDATAPLIGLAGTWNGLLLVLRLLPPRPRFRRIVRQPGMAACLVALLAMSWTGLGVGLLFTLEAFLPSGSFDGLSFVQNLTLGHVFPLVGVAVLSTWTQMRLSRRWPPPADWIDRSGRFVGFLWILIGLAWTLRAYAQII